jgi:hypothetical protein
MRTEYRENWRSNIPVHQPKPQKAISMMGIENTAHMPTSEQQPFHHQIPQVNGAYTPDHPPFSHSRHQSFAQPTVGTPLSNIPERAIHAQPFQPYGQPGAPQYPNPYQPAGYYYPQQYPPNAPVIAPMFIQNDNGSQQNGQGYLIPTIGPAAPGAPIAGAPTPMGMNMGSGAPSGMVAHEQNGMVYYYDPAQLYTSQQGHPGESHQYPQQQHQHQHPQHPQHQHQASGSYGMMGDPAAANYYYQQPAGGMYYPPQ